ncbi:hypothetical protein V6N12_008380 [Hibiscus sabdariffa]|uniref:Uncharacterized protein n=1 Tax=Hibiscus sabdariffa TaxID=183260 RepID=A0ABR2BIP8_9ROSI
MEKGGKIFISRNVVFAKHIFPFAQECSTLEGDTTNFLSKSIPFTQCASLSSDPQVLSSCDHSPVLVNNGIRSQTQQQAPPSAPTLSNEPDTNPFASLFTPDYGSEEIRDSSPHNSVEYATTGVDSTSNSPLSVATPTVPMEAAPNETWAWRQLPCMKRLKLLHLASIHL